MIQLDGSDGGGQILRTALSLSMLTGQPFRMVRIRGRRRKPGLRRQHLTCVRAAVEISGGAADGDELNATELVFQPGPVRAGDYCFRIGTAGSTTLLAQCLLPALWSAGGPSSLRLEGGTHNPLAPSADFLARVFLPQIARMGLRAEVEVEKPGFAPAGGGVLLVRTPGDGQARPLELLERGEPGERRIDCLIAHIDDSVAERELKAARRALDWPEACCAARRIDEASGSGNILEIEQAFANVTERVSGHGALGRSSERVARGAAKAMRDYLDSGAAAGLHLADQLLLPLALAGGGGIVTLGETEHIRTQIATLEAFLDLRFEVAPEGSCVRVSVGPA